MNKIQYQEFDNKENAIMTMGSPLTQPPTNEENKNKILKCCGEEGGLILYLAGDDQVEALDIEAAELVDDILVDRGDCLLEQVQNQGHQIGDQHSK